MDPQPEPEPKVHDFKKLRTVLIGVGVVVVGIGTWLLWPQTPAAAPRPEVNAANHTPVVRPALFATGLHSPTAIVAPPSDTRLFVVEQGGTIRILDSAGTVQATPFLDIHTKIAPGGEMGLLGLAFDPDFKQNGYFYVNYFAANQTAVIARYKATDATTADATSEKILFSIKRQYQNHNGGDLLFGKDGYLYTTLGDGGGAGDPQNHAQDANSYFGKILRIDTTKDAKPEVWAQGLRNPWRFSLDKTTGDLYIADVGQSAFEEVNIQKAGSKGGENYGWRCYEAAAAYNTTGCKEASTYVAPALSYDHSNGRCSITGGYVYRGSQFAALNGLYFYADYCSGELFYASNKDGKLTGTLALKTPYAITTFGQSNTDELYFADFATGSIYHIQDIAD